MLFGNLYSCRLETGVPGNLFSFLKEVKPLVLYAMEHRIAMEPMKGKWASSRVDLGYNELFCLPEVTSVFLSSCDSVLRDSLVLHQKKSRLLTCLIGNTGMLCTQCRGMEPHLPARGMSYGISRVAAGTWGIFSSYSGDGHSKLHFVQQSQDTCLFTRTPRESKLGLPG